MAYVPSSPNYVRGVERKQSINQTAARFGDLLDAITLVIDDLSIDGKTSRAAVVQFAEKVDDKHAILLEKSFEWDKTRLKDQILKIHYKGQNDKCDDLENDVGRGMTLVYRPGYTPKDRPKKTF